MRSKRVWRYYCDFCKKSGCNSGHIRRHEQHCLRNPESVCRMCPRLGENQKPITELVAAFVNGGLSLNALRNDANGCPVCIMAGILAWREVSETTTEDVWIDFDLKKELAAVWKQVDEAAEEDERVRYTELVAYNSPGSWPF